MTSEEPFRIEEQEKVAKRFNKLREDIDALIQDAFEELSSMLVVFEMFQDKMIVREEKNDNPDASYQLRP